MKLNEEKKLRFGAILLFAMVGLLAVWLAKRNAQIPSETPIGHYNTGALLKKDGSGCVDAQERSVACPPGTIPTNAAPSSTRPASGVMKMSPSTTSPQPAGTNKSR